MTHAALRAIAALLWVALWLAVAAAIEVVTRRGW